MSEVEGSHVLGVGLTEELVQLASDAVGASDALKKITFDEFAETFDQFNDGMYDFIIVGDNIGEVDPSEVAQLGRNQCPQTPIFYATGNKLEYRPKDFVKNGFTEAFFTPMDNSFLVERMQANLSSRHQRRYKNIRLIDMHADSEVDFSTYVFLPLNNKYVRFSNKNEKFSQKKLDKLSNQEISTIYIDQDELEKFYDYTASKLLELSDEANPMSATEKEEKLQTAIRGFFTDIFDASIKADFDAGKELLGTCQNIVSSYVTKGQGDFYAQLIGAIGGQLGGYQHSATVSTIAALFAIGIGHERPEDLAMAGFLHDMSLAEFTGQDKPESEWDDTEKEHYNAHPLRTVNMLKEKRMVVSEDVEKAIMQHHEKYNGKGFPKQLSGERISTDAQLLALADNFDYMTSQRPGQKRLSPQEALDEIQKQGIVGSFLLNKVRKLLPG